MRISTKGRYALRLMIDVADHKESGRIPIREIAKRQSMPVKYLEQIAAVLTKSGLLLSVRGANGGYTLARPAEQYQIGEILRLTEGRLAPVACLDADSNPCERQEICPTLNFWKGLQQVVNDYVDSMTLKDLLDSECDM
ncbi:MAG: Rrf2 family transcriptional regulator [Kiritimatiellaeota bacterium]|nr:Rrf2 family transcriptional regulator [Kiritimatiellota bacterium]